ncbi:hypothetical protein OAU89_02685, partial [bacterium]|nr:hypothetical protein [bacterium]
IDEMEVQFNPADINMTWGTRNSGDNEQMGNTLKLTGGKQMIIKKTDFPPATAKFKLIFDNSILRGSQSQSGMSITKLIDKFKAMCLDVSPEVHAPSYLKLTWGEFKFNCELTSLSVNYTLFSSDGKPLRAELDCTFSEFQDAVTKAIEDAGNSPDMTRVVTVLEGDTLPLLCYKHYGSSQHYLKVAKVNKLASASYLRPGQRVVFPPLVDEINSHHQYP